MVHVDVDKVRETVTVGMIAFFLGLAVYTLLGLAWTFKTTFEAAEGSSISFDRPIRPSTARIASGFVPICAESPASD